MLHEKILTSLVKAEIQGRGIPAIHRYEQNYFFIFCETVIKVVNIVVPIFALGFETLIAAITAPVCVQILIIDHFILH